MKYFKTVEERKISGSSLYFEFQLGEYHGKHWLVDSLYLHADIFDDLSLFNLFSKSIKDFYYYGPTKVNKDEWENLITNANAKIEWKSIIEELENWGANCFTKHECFTICGI